MPNFGARSNENLKGVHPDLVRVMRQSILNSPFDFAIVQGVRTQDYQDDLYCQGRSTEQVRKAGIMDRPGKPNQPVVTKTRHSLHIPQEDGFGHAVDFAVCVNDKVDYGKENDYKYPIIARHILEVADAMRVDVESGAFWKFVDSGHVQINK